MPTTTVSCPGKVLLLGGYVVLTGSPGLTLALTARFTSACASDPGAGNGRRLVVACPQFRSVYTYDTSGDEPELVGR